MPGRKKDRVGNRIHRIWKDIPISGWLSFLEGRAPGHRWKLKGDRIVGTCIVHSETHPSFNIFPERGYAHCYGCGLHITNPLGLASRILKSTHQTALIELRKQFRIQADRNFIREANAFQRIQKIKKMILIASNQLLVNALAKNGETEAKRALEYLKSRIPVEQIHLLPIGVFPGIKKLLDNIDGSEGELREIVNILKPIRNLGVSLLFFYYSRPDEIAYIKARKINSREFAILDDQTVDAPGFFGLNMFVHLLGKLNRYPLYVTEGDFDVLSILTKQLETGGDDTCIVGTGGTLSEGIDALAELEFKEILLLPDNDLGGIHWTRNLLSENKKVKKIFSWKNYKAKDIDELFRNKEYPFVKSVLENKKNFLSAADWLFKQAKKTIKEEEFAEEDLVEFAAKEVSVVANPIQREALIEKFARSFDVKVNSIQREVVVNNDTPESQLIAKTTELLERKVYHFIAQQQGERGRPEVLAWSHHKKVLRRIPVGRGSDSVVSLDIGNPLDFIELEVGDFEFLNTEKRKASYMLKSKLATRIITEAVQRIAAKPPPIDKLRRLGAGIHYFNERETGGKPEVFVVNSDNKFFMGKVEDDETVFTETNIPAFKGKYYFRPGGEAWSQEIRNIDDFNESSKFDIKDLYETLLEVFDTGWRFHNQEVETKFLAADTLYTPFSSVFGRMIMTDLTGESHSGKSTLLHFLSKKDGNPYHNICEASVLMEDFTEAGIRQLMNGVTLRLLLDEFENTDSKGAARGDKRALAVADILSAIRSLFSGQMSVRGTKGGTSKLFDMRFPITVTGLYTMRENRDINRFIHIRTKSISGFGEPLARIGRRFKPEKIAWLRRGITLWGFSQIPQIVKTSKEIIDKISSGEISIPEMFMRIQYHLIPTLTVMKLAGMDYTQFIHDFCNIKVDEMRQQGAINESTHIWDALLHTPIPLRMIDPSGGGQGLTSIAKVLADPNLKHYFNDANTGIYYIPEKNWLLVFWQKAIRTILDKSTLFSNIKSSGRIKMIADEDPSVIPSGIYSGNGFMSSTVFPFVGAKVTTNEISVYDLGDKIVGSAPVTDEEIEHHDKEEKIKIVDEIF